MIIKYLIFCGLVLCLLSCSTKTATEVKTDNQKKTVSNNLISTSGNPTTESPVKVYGTFKNVEGNGEHEWGYSADLWRQGDKIYGLFSGSSSSRLIGDPPTGILENQVFDEKTGKFSFRTKLPSFIYEFDGVLTKEVMKGNLLNTTTNETEKITLKRDEEWSSELMEEFKSYEDWKEYADKILKFRGPK